VLKTLVVTRSQGKPILIMIPADRQLDLKTLAMELGEKKLAMAGHEEAERLTRLEVGGISALALLNRPFEILIDSSARECEHVYVSAGRKGTNLRVPLAGLVKVTGARWVSAARSWG
jgi:Cys-tRNA(Pro)/Cys-tRNA(Cys) deacylase